MKVSEFLNQSTVIPPLLLGAFYGRFEITPDNSCIYTYSAYRNSTHTLDNRPLWAQSRIDYIRQLNKKCEPYCEWKFRDDKKYGHSDIIFSLENDVGYNRTTFFNLLYRKIITTDFVFSETLTKEKRLFIIGFCELRASVDKKYRYLSMDYRSHSKSEVKRLRLLIDNFNVPSTVLNFNFREFQQQFIDGTAHRDTQLRIDPLWYMKTIGFINNYKAENFRVNFPNTGVQIDDDIKTFNTDFRVDTADTTFESRVAFYANNVFDRREHLTAIDLHRFHDLIGRNRNNEFSRDSGLAYAFRIATVEQCACCYDIYDREARVHIVPSTGLYNFEIHHMISVGQVEELDVYDNLVKLCPECHRKLRRSGDTENNQKNMIIKILNEKPNVKEFCETFFNETDFNTLVDNIWRHLK